MRLPLFALLGFLLLAATSPALAERRVALVIGNGAYETAAPLANPGNDAAAMAAKLQELGFEVIFRIDLDQSEMAATLGEFAAALDGADVGLFFYAGHGIQFDGHNYLISTNATLGNQFALQSDAFALDQILEVMQQSAALNIVLLDACRNNPFVDRLRDSLQATRSPAVDEGLAPMELQQGDTMIVYATAANRTAADGLGKHSPFTRALLAHIGTPGVEISLLLKRVVQDVRQATFFHQSPEVLSAMATEFYFAARLPDPPPEPGYDTTQIGALDVDGAIEAGRQGEAVADLPDRVELALGLGSEEIVRIQTALNALGFDLGSEDGNFGRRSREALVDFQQYAFLPDTGYLDPETLTELMSTIDLAPKTYDGEWLLFIRRKVTRYTHDNRWDKLGTTSQIAQVHLTCSGAVCLVTKSKYYTVQPDNPFADLVMSISGSGRLELRGLVSTHFHDHNTAVPNMRLISLSTQLPRIVPNGRAINAAGNQFDEQFAFEITLRRLHPEN